MKDLKCGLTECRFNKGYCCCADCVTIGSNTSCKSYDPVNTSRGSMFEAADEFVPSNYTIDTSIKCHADCAFNKDYKCYANGITVMNDPGSVSAACLTFIKK